MVVRASGDHLETTTDQSLTKRLGIGFYLLAVSFKGGLKRLTKSHRFCPNDMHQGATLYTWDNLAIDKFSHTAGPPTLGCNDPEWIVKILPHQDHPSPGPPQGLMGCGSYHMAMFHGIIEF